MTILEEIERIAKDKNNLHANLLTARPPIKEIIFWALGDHTFDLPTEALDERNFGDIAFAQNPRGDALAIEAFSLTRVFVPEQNPDLDRQKRVRILREILRICTVRERQFLLNAIRTRTIAGISREIVLEVYGQNWLAPRPPFSRTVMPKVAGKQADNRKEYVGFQELKKLGYIQG